ncbi:MAG: diguanylate cyclase, partial [Gammaproteobacteria bacterium]|nr:diguanylate cyclase [Gammaproteobacteria bacterium]
MHPLLQRQIRRYFSADEVPEEMARLFAAIDQTYQQADQDRQLIEQSLELSSQELNERYDVLEQQLQINRAAKNDLERTLSLLDTTFDATEEGILVVASDGSVVKFNKVFVDLWNIPRSVLDTGDDAELLASAISQVADPEAFRRRVDELYDDPHDDSVDTIELIDGRVLERFTRPQVMQGETVGRVWSFRDITARKATEERLELSRRVFDVSTQGIMVTDGQLRVMDANRALCDLLKLDISDVLGHSLPDLSNTQQCSSFNSNFVAKLTADGEWWGELRTSLADDDHRVVWINFSAVRSDQGDLTHYVGIFSDITKLKEVEEKLQQLAYFDPLTGLPNRRLFKEKVEKTIASEERLEQKHALLFLDLDRFKFVNDSLGHLSGDELLVRVAERLGREIRRGDLASRQGGDEFAVALFDLQDDAMVGDIAKRIIDSITRPFRIKNQDLYIGASVGVCVMPQQATTFDDAMRKADMAMYLAKASGKGRYCFWDQETQAQMDQRILVESELREAIRLGQLHMYYQPIVDCVSGKPVSMEALLRWEHAQRGPIPPDQFVRIAEEVGLITELEEWVINDV